MAERKSKEMRRQEILDGASRCFSQKGYLGSSMKDICETVGLAKGGVYWHFPSKKEILKGLMDQFCSTNNSQWKMLAQIDITPESLEEAGWSFIEYNVSNPQKVRLFSVLEAEAAKDEELQAIYGESQKVVLDNLKALSRRVLTIYPKLQMEEGDLAQLLNLTVNGLVRQSVVGLEKEQIRSIWQGFIRNLLD